MKSIIGGDVLMNEPVRFCPFMSYQRQSTTYSFCHTSCQFFRREDCLIASLMEAKLDNFKNYNNVEKREGDDK